MDEPAVVNEDSGSAQQPDSEQTAQVQSVDSSNNDSKPSDPVQERFCPLTDFDDEIVF